ncbi:hypothetical protein QZH41_004000 [Actinostola sp. cb2023]|nr:hypothetical protein QZH41_004000 [Actinostola sp. cb2023]
MSCRNQCLHPRQVVYEDKLSCYCDVDCEFFKDCCADYDDFCKPGDGNATEANNTLGFQTPSADIPLNATMSSTPSQSSNGELWQCFESNIVKKRTKGIWMIGSCPNYWPKDYVFFKCINVSNANKVAKESRYLPVFTSNGRVYHNRFCAQCNGVSFNETKSYQFSYKCEFPPPQNLSISERMQFILSNCTSLGWTPGQGDPRRYCLKLKSTCVFQTSSMQEQCINGNVRIVNDKACIYKNVYCARCNYNSIMCGPNISAMVNKCDPNKPTTTEELHAHRSIITNHGNSSDS